MADIFLSVKRKLVERSSSSSSETNSPEGKRTKDEDAEVEDEVLRVQNMADDVTDKLDKIIAQLRKLDSIETTLNEMCDRVAKIEGEIKILKSNTNVMEEKLKETDTKVKEMDTGLTGVNEQVEELQKKIEDIEESKKKELLELHSKQLYAEAYSRRENLKFFGIPERKEENGGDTQKALYDFIEKVLDFGDPVNNIEFQRVHRIGKVNSNKPRAIIARFLRFSDREKVLRAGFKINKNTNFKVLEDYPQEIITRRRAQMSKLMKAKKKGKKVSFSKKEPDKLYIDGVYVPA